MVPGEIAALLQALRFDAPVPLPVFSDPQWKRILAFADQSQLTLLLEDRCRADLPDWVRERLARNLASNAARLDRLTREMFAIAGRIGTEFVLLKGVSQPSPDPRRRIQYDIDLYCPPETVYSARDAIATLGYEPLAEMEDFPTDHLPVLIRKTGWEWRGDFFDPDLPVSVDLHFRFWDQETERIRIPGLEEFWERRTTMEIAGRPIPVLDPADRLGYAALHLARHLLRGNVRPYHVWEIAWFLDTTAADAAWWDCWRSLHPLAMRQVEALAFQLASRWFGCRLPPQVDRLPEPVLEWFDEHACCSLESRPNKDELLLHLRLLERGDDKRAVLRRRLLPLRLPGPVDAIHLPEERLTCRIRVRRRIRYAAFVGGRVIHHVRVLIPVLWSLTESRGLGRLLLGTNLYYFGFFIFFVLYNLHLLGLGWREDFLGLVAGSLTTGTILGALPAGMLARRFGLQPALLAGIAGSGLVSALRVVVDGRTALMASAFLGGLLAALWQVSLPPMIAALTPKRSQSVGFSLWIGTGIATGIAGGFAAGQLAAWIGNRNALLIGCGIALASMWPLSRVRVAAEPEKGRIYPRGPFLWRFLLAFALWNLAVGAFNPLFNAYFARKLGMSARQIGSIFSMTQAFQVAAVLAAPVVLRKLGTVSGIAAMQAATAASLALLAAASSPAAAAGFYAAYSSCQYMSEPGLFSLLMNRVRPGERGGASAIGSMVMFSAHAIAAVLAGAAVVRWDYPVVLVVASLAALLAAAMFRLLLGRSDTGGTWGG